MNYVLVLLLLWSCSTEIVNSSGRFTNIKCISLDEDFTTVTQCSLKMVKRNVVGLNIYCQLHKGPVSNVTVNVALYKKSNGYQPFLINATADLCKFFENRKKYQIFMILSQYFLRNSNVNHTCPYDHDIIVDNLILDSNLFATVPLQNGDYMFKVLAGILNAWKVEFKVFFRKN